MRSCQMLCIILNSACQLAFKKKNWSMLRVSVRLTCTQCSTLHKTMHEGVQGQWLF